MGTFQLSCTARIEVVSTRALTVDTGLAGEGGKLEAEYIQRFLGVLTPLEESRLCQLKYSLQDTHKGKLPNDAHLLRFLRAREFDLAAAKEMVLKSLLWRKSHAVDKILSTYQQPPVVQQFFPGAWHHSDKLGRPLFVLRLGHMDIKGLLRAVGDDGLLKLVLSLCEDGLRRCAVATTQRGKPISTWTLLVDLEGLSMRHLWRPGVKCLFRIIEIMEAHYPETMGLALIVRTPRVFPVLWTLIGPLIDDNTKNKFMVHSSSEVATDALAQFLDPDIIPHFLGGPCFFLASEGGHVPKALQSFHHNSPTDVEADGILESLYTTGYVYKGLPHEVLVPVPSSGCVLTWDFDVVKGNCEFLLYRADAIIQPETLAPPPSPPLGVLSPGALVAAIGDAHAHSPVAFNRSLKLGLDLFLDAKPMRAAEGDSVQGSHFCRAAGTYIMQWRHAEPSHSAAAAAFDFSLPHKCKVVYYREILDGHDFRGSMASLNSCRSSFSSLAAHGSLPPPL